MTTMSQDGYQAVVEFDQEAGLFHGEVLGLRDVITFQGKSVAELQRAFKASITDYRAFCAERGEAPEKPFSGQFVVRTDPAAHRQAVLMARRSGLSLNAWINAVIAQAGAGDPANGPSPKARAKVSRPKTAGSTSLRASSK